MDARRFDRNADQLAQIFHHITRVPGHKYHRALMMRHRMLILLEEALKLNDELAKMAEKEVI